MPLENTVEVAADVADKAGRYLTFQLGEESYGISVLKVREIIQMQPITRIPRTPAYLKGVINLRGKVIPVADLRIKFAFDKAEVSERKLAEARRWAPMWKRRPLIPKQASFHE